MTEEPMRREETAVNANAPGPRRWLMIAGGVLLAFLLGLVPMWISNRQLNRTIEERDRELRRGRIQNVLSQAAIYSRRGEYETARQNASSFFTDLSQEIDKGDGGVLTEQERIGINRVTAERDEVITLLSRNDPAAGERLSNLFIEYTGVTHNK